MITEKHTVTLTKHTIRQLRDRVINDNITAIVASANNKSLAVAGWIIEDRGWFREDANTVEHNHVYTITVQVTYDRADDKKPNSETFKSICHTMFTRAAQPAFGRWTLATVDGNPYVAPEEAIANTGDEVHYTETDIPPDWEDYFDHLFGLDPHIRRIRKSLEAAINSDWKNRFHSVLVGPPGCGKSDIGRSVRAALGEDAVWELDATATTAAGIYKELSEMEILPRVILLEEIEKAPEAAMSVLLGILDMRGEIRKVTARADIQRDTKCVAIATVNDYALFQKLQAGALSSRFTNVIHFKRPTRETLALILTREVGKVEGNPEWITPTLDYCEAHDITDPRQVISICLCGADDLLDGSYQTMLDATSEPA